MNYFSKDEGFHSISNNPASVYDQLLAEYGLLGLLAFLICYLGYFLKRYKHLTYGLPLVAFLAMVLVTDYWFEQLSIMIVFELMLFLNIKEREQLVNQISHA
jgi:O-antigen ligase